MKLNRFNRNAVSFASARFYDIVPQSHTEPIAIMPAQISDAYRALWTDPELNARIDSDIERNRKTNVTLRVTDASGKPVPGARVECVQTASAFHFGANIFMLDGYPTPELNARYEEAFLGLFNAATVPFYWRGLEVERGHPRYAADSVPVSRRPPPDRVVAFCEQHDLRMHGHPLVWDFFKWSAPDWLSRDPVQAEENARQWEARVREIAARYSGRIKRWDGLNESLCAVDPSGRPYKGSRVDKGESCPMPVNYERMAFEWETAAFPSGTRFDINEVTAVWRLDDPREPWLTVGKYRAQIARLLREGTPIGGIGLQFHNFQDDNLREIVAGMRFIPQQLLQVLDTLAPFGLPLHVSEITITAPDNDASGQAAQAEVARNFYRLWFSHPSVDSITWWNVPDGGAAPGEDRVFSGLLNRDLTPKLAYDVLKNLLHNEWRTQSGGATDADGRHDFRGFAGTYRVTVSHGGEMSTHEVRTSNDASVHVLQV
ncbi:glycoside hydrolase family 10 [Opitutaceae bacterium TAV4]|nr:glycoside hydrolase family 10 [Opitutaceae bacterium TAV4]RRJ99139.1 glycoside hydrolase family 10 [Opitutaceae bacterium TAV3]